MRCKCPERKKHILTRRWVVEQRLCNHAAFNGYRHTPSAYSSVRCLECRALWRTNAAYVADLKDANHVP